MPRRLQPPPVGCPVTASRRLPNLIREQRLRRWHEDNAEINQNLIVHVPSHLLILCPPVSLTILGYTELTLLCMHICRGTSSVYQVVNET